MVGSYATCEGRREATLGGDAGKTGCSAGEDPGSRWGPASAEPRFRRRAEEGCGRASGATRRAGRRGLGHSAERTSCDACVGGPGGGLEPGHGCVRGSAPARTRPARRRCRTPGGRWADVADAAGRSRRRRWGCGFAGAVLLAHHQVELRGPGPILLAEPTVPQPLGVGLLVLLPQQRQRHALCAATPGGPRSNPARDAPLRLGGGTGNSRLSRPVSSTDSGSGQPSPATLARRR